MFGGDSLLKMILKVLYSDKEVWLSKKPALMHSGPAAS
jgi:hypothetical protein